METINKKTDFSSFEVSKRTNETDGISNGKLDMRINKFKPPDILLIFRLDYEPEVFIDTYTLYATVELKIKDNGLLLDNPQADEVLDYFSTIYKETGDSLYRLLNTETKKHLGRGVSGFLISMSDARRQVEIIFSNYFK